MWADRCIVFGSEGGTLVAEESIAIPRFRSPYRRCELCHVTTSCNANQRRSHCASESILKIILRGTVVLTSHLVLLKACSEDQSLDA